MNRLTQIRASIAAIVVIAAAAVPLAASAATPLHAVDPTHVKPVPSDTASRIDKVKGEHASQTKKKLKGRQGGTVSNQLDPKQFIPDQRWETEFFVENDLTTQQHGIFALAAFTRNSDY